MYKDKARILLVVAAIFAMLSVVAVSPALSDESSAASIDGTSLSVIYNADSTPTVHADEDVTINVWVQNNYAYTIILGLSVSTDEDLSTSVNQATQDLASGKYFEYAITVSADKYAHQATHELTLKFTVQSFSSTVEDTGELTLNVKVLSSLSSDDQYNKFLGIWNNDLSSPLDGAWFAALVTALIWFLIGYIVAIIAIPIVMKIIMKKDDPDYEPMKRALSRMCFLIIVLNGIGKAIRVLGMNEEIVNSVNVLFYICYILVAVIVGWRIYCILVNVIVRKIGVRDFVPGGSKSDMESLKPLFLYIGEIVLAVATVGAIMNLLGFNMTAIITSAGIVSLGITLGAQSVLNQFFSGLVLLATRPFKKGDLITINGGSITYRVRKVNIMQTELENWDNTDITMVPNSTLTSGIVKNITRDTLKCKIHVFISVGYGNDLAFVRATMLEVANSNPRVIKDGSVGRPSTRVTDFEDSNIQMRLSVYVDDFNDSGVIGGELRQAMYNKFLEKGISIDYTRIVVQAADPNSSD